MNENSQHWSEVKEVGGSPWHFRFMLWMVCHLPLCMVKGLTAIICFFFWLGAASVRSRSRLYLDHVARAGKFKPSSLKTYKHIFSFALSMMEKLLGWKGAIKLNRIETQKDDLPELVNQLNRGEGAFLLCSHLGNMEMLRSLTGYGKFHTDRNFKVYPVVDFSGTTRFNALLRELNPDLMNQVIDANQIGIDTAVRMKELIADGNLVVIAGDRTSANSRDRKLETDFLAQKASFPEGAFSLAGILGVPVYFAFAIRKRDFDIQSPYEMHIVRAKTSLACPRKERPKQMKALLQEYTSILEKLCVSHPYQWYNFYNFWEG